MTTPLYVDQAFALPLEVGYPHFSFEIVLDGQTYGFEFRWNDRDGGWHAAVSDTAGNQLAKSRVSVGGILFLRNVSGKTPPGILYVFDTSGKGKDADFADLGDRVQVYYYPTVSS